MFFNRFLRICLTSTIVLLSLFVHFPTAFHRFLSSSDLAASKRNGRGRGRPTARGRVRTQVDVDDQRPTNGATSAPASFVFAAPATPTADEERRQLLLRRLNEISLQKRRLEERQQPYSKEVPLNGAEGTFVSRGSPSDRDSRGGHDDALADYSPAKPRESGVPEPDKNVVKKKHSAPKRRRGEPAEEVVDVADSPPHHPERTHRNGQNRVGKSKSLSNIDKPSPPAIDLDAVGDPSSTPNLESFTGERNKSKSNRNASPQGSPTLSARGSGRVRTPSVLLSSQPGEKSASNQNSSGSKNRQVSYCLRLVKDLMRLKDGYAFSRPIDQLWALDQLPGYFDIVKQPMDLGTIRHWLEKNHYMRTSGKEEVEEVVFDLDAFKSDVCLVFGNAKAYNRPGDLFYESASRLLEKFEGKMKQMPSSEELDHQAAKKNKKRKKGAVAVESAPKKSDVPKKRKVGSSNGDGETNGQVKRPVSKKKPSAASGGKPRASANSSSKKKKAAEPEVIEVKDSKDMGVEDIEVRLRALKRHRTLLESGSPASPPASGSTSYMAQAQALYHVEMTYREKVELSNNVGKLPADKLQKIVALATKNKMDSMEVNHNEEIELDIDSMNNETLREMEAYVNQILSKKKRGVSALQTSPNADILQMTPSQVSEEIENLTSILRKKSKGKSKELIGTGDDGNNGGGGKDKRKKSFYDTESSSDSDSEGSGSGSSDDSSSDSSDSSADESDGDTMRKRRERNLAHQQAMQAAGTPLPSPAYQNSQRSG